MQSGYIEVTPRPKEQELADFYEDMYYNDGVTATYQNSYTNQEISQKHLGADCTVELITKNIDVGSVS